MSTYNEGKAAYVLAHPITYTHTRSSTPAHTHTHAETEGELMKAAADMQRLIDTQTMDLEPRPFGITQSPAPLPRPISKCRAKNHRVVLNVVTTFVEAILT